MRYGLLLNGNGAQADFQLGAWQALNESNLHLDWVASSSIGGIAAALIAQKDLHQISQFLSDAVLEKITALNDSIAGLYLQYWSDLNFHDFRLQFLQTFVQKAMPLRRTLSRYLDEAIIRRSSCRLMLTTIDPQSLSIVKRTIEEIPNGQLIPTLLLGAVFPVFRTQRDQDATYFEAGFLSELPLETAVLLPCKKLMAVGYSPVEVRRAVRKNQRDLSFLTIQSSEYLDLSAPENAAANGQDHQRHAKLGYLDTLKALGQLTGRKLYINPYGPHQFFDLVVAQIGFPPQPPLERQILMALLGIDKPYTSLEQVDILEKILALMNRSSWRKSDNTILAMLEMTAWTIQVPKLKIYMPDQLIFEILDWAEQTLKINAPSASDVQEPNFFDCVRAIAVHPESLSVEQIDAFREQAAPEMILSLITFYYIQAIALNFA